MPTRNIELTSQDDRFDEEQIASGRFKNTTCFHAALIGITFAVAGSGFAMACEGTQPVKKDSSSTTTERDKAKIRVIERVKKLGGDVRVSDRTIYRVWFGPESRVRDDDLKTLDPTGEIIVLVLDGLPLTDECLKHAASMTGLKELVLKDVPVTGSGLVHLAHRDDFYGLTLTNSKITDERLKPLSKLKGLRNLSLAGTPVTDKSLEIIGSLKHLKRLNLHETSIMDEGLKHLDGLEDLLLLTLSETKITGTGFEEISLPGLEILFLERTEMKDQSLPFLQQFTNLSSLDISYTKVTDEGLRHLENVKSLRSVSAYETTVTTRGAMQLKAALPKCEVSFGMDPVELEKLHNPVE